MGQAAARCTARVPVPRGVGRGYPPHVTPPAWGGALANGRAWSLAFSARPRSSAVGWAGRPAGRALDQSAAAIFRDAVRGRPWLAYGPAGLAVRGGSALGRDRRRGSAREGAGRREEFCSVRAGPGLLGFPRRRARPRWKAHRRGEERVAMRARAAGRRRPQPKSKPKSRLHEITRKPDNKVRAPPARRKEQPPGRPRRATLRESCAAAAILG